jgi:hypothetical protein
LVRVALTARASIASKWGLSVVALALQVGCEVFPASGGVVHLAADLEQDVRVGGLALLRVGFVSGGLACSFSDPVGDVCFGQEELRLA